MTFVPIRMSHHICGESYGSCFCASGSSLEDFTCSETGSSNPVLDHLTPPNGLTRPNVLGLRMAAIVSFWKRGRNDNNAVEADDTGVQPMTMC